MTASKTCGLGAASGNCEWEPATISKCPPCSSGQLKYPARTCGKICINGIMYLATTETGSDHYPGDPDVMNNPEAYGWKIETFCNNQWNLRNPDICALAKERTPDAATTKLLFCDKDGFGKAALSALVCKLLGAAPTGTGFAGG